MTENKKILIGIPSGDLVHGRFMTDLLALFMFSKDMVLDMVNHRSSRITGNRNSIVKTAREFGSTHILFIDADMTFPKDGLLTLLSYDKDIVCATACKREEGPQFPIGIPVNEEEMVTNRRLIKMRFVGMPFMLVKMSVFDKLQEPYFAEPIVAGDIVPEDDYFCRTALAAGFEIWCDLGVSMQMGHLGIKEYKIAPVNQGKPELRVVGAT